MNRRTFLKALTSTLLAAPPAAEAQQAGKVPKIGFIGFDALPERGPDPNPFWEPMRTLGWVEGQNVTMERRGAGGDWNRVPQLALELVQRKVDVFLVVSEGMAQGVQRANSRIPICVYGGDLQASGVVRNLAKPEGNTTGVQTSKADLAAKRFELLREVVPKLTRAGVLVSNPYYPTEAAMARSAGEAARALGLQFHVVDISFLDFPTRKGNFEDVLADLKRRQISALLVTSTPSMWMYRSQIMSLVDKSRSIAVYENRSWAAAGGLMSYGPVSAELWRGLAQCVDKMLRGAKPSDVPVQQPTQLEFVINLKTAKALGLTIPPSLLQRADQVIE